jgi:hypothetical protein
MRLLTGFRGRVASGVLIGSAFAGVPLAHLPNTGSQPAVVADYRFHPAACGASCVGDNSARLEATGSRGRAGCRVGDDPEARPRGRLTR